MSKKGDRIEEKVEKKKERVREDRKEKKKQDKAISGDELKKLLEEETELLKKWR